MWLRIHICFGEGGDCRRIIYYEIQTVFTTIV